MARYYALYFSNTEVAEGARPPRIDRIGHTISTVMHFCLAMQFFAAAGRSVASSLPFVLVLNVALE